MGRPLNKKYFGNRNIGTTGTGDNGIGGEGIASINWSELGDFQGNSNVQVLTAIPALPAPTLPSGVQATWTMQFEVESVFTGSGKTDLEVGDTFGVASIPGMVAIVTDLSGDNAEFSVLTADGGARGGALALADIPKDTVGITLTKIAGDGTAATFLCDITFQIRESTVTITEKGSGYVGTETFTFAKPGTTSGDVPAGTIVLTTDSGNVGSSTNQENAIVAYAYVTGNNLIADIKKQVSGRRYKVTTSEGTLTCKLVTDGVANAAGEMTITATDANGNTYYVSKLTAHLATLVRLVDDGGDEDWVYATGARAPWSFAAASGSVVQIANK